MRIRQYLSTIAVPGTPLVIATDAKNAFKYFALFNFTCSILYRNVYALENDLVTIESIELSCLFSHQR